MSDTNHRLHRDEEREKAGRPRKEIDERVFEKLFKIACALAEIVGLPGVVNFEVRLQGP